MEPEGVFYATALHSPMVGPFDPPSRTPVFLYEARGLSPPLSEEGSPFRHKMNCKDPSDLRNY